MCTCEVPRVERGAYAGCVFVDGTINAVQSLELWLYKHRFLPSIAVGRGYYAIVPYTVSPYDTPHGNVHDGI